jgi:hypothetical protein
MTQVPGSGLSIVQTVGLSIGIIVAIGSVYPIENI